MTAHDVLAILPALRYLEFHMRNLLDAEPVRLFNIAAAAVALAAFYLPGLPVALVLALVAAILGVGEKVRSKVTPVDSWS